MVAPYPMQATQNGNKCPHGLPAGTCPICSGMGGGSMKKDRDTPRRAGEMTYNECMAAWIKIQAQKDAKMQEKIDKIAMMAQKDLQAKISENIHKMQKMLDKFMQQVETLPNFIQAPIKIIVKVIIQPVMNLIAKIPVIINQIQTFMSNITTLISSVAEKLTAILGEVKNFINANVTQKIKKALKTVLSFFAEKGSEEEDEETQKIKSREIKKIIKSLFRIRRKEEEKENADTKLKKAS